MYSSKIFAALCVVAMTLMVSGCDSTSVPAELQRDIGTVVLEVDFGGKKTSKTIDVVCSPKSTVLSSLERAQNMKKLEFKFRGTGETAFVTSIDGVDNEGADGENWTYRVNDELGDRSAGILGVKPGDTILWSFGARPKEL